MSASTIITIITIITVLIIISMIVSGMSYSRLQAMEKIQKKTSSYRQQVDEILEHIALLLKIDPEYQLITQLQTLALNMLQLANNLSPQNILQRKHAR
jgi:flagellar biosynthesis protein FliQ